MGKVLTQVATEMTYDECEKELSEELQAESDKIRYGNAHKEVDVKIHRMLHVAPHYKESYKQVAPPLLLISKRLQKCVSQKLKVKKREPSLIISPWVAGSMYGMPSGETERSSIRGNSRTTVWTLRLRY